MALNQKALQKKRAKKAEKRKAVKKAGAATVLRGFTGEWAAAIASPIADALVPRNLFDVGMGMIIFSRKLPDGRLALASFLVDSFCLGVKNALYKILDSQEYAQIVEQSNSWSEGTLESEEPAYARKLVESAAAYAKSLGFDPHPDYQIAKTLFGNVNSADCTEEFEFGLNGKPVYIAGPDDTPAIQNRILKQLDKQGCAGVAVLPHPGHSQE